MRNAVLIVMTLALTAVFGCQTSSPRGGGSGPNEGFRVIIPAGNTSVQQGQAESVYISLNRDQSFKRDVTLDISSSDGISVDPTTVLIKSSDRPIAQVRLTAATDAAIGMYHVDVNATPETGEPTSARFNVHVVNR